MLRLLFEKKGNAVWISHLDLMRLFQRAFKRADLPLTHTQGFNPRPSVSIALPLSVGVSSCCELLDFELDGVEVSCDEIQNRLNQTLVDGIQVLQVYTAGKKIRDLSYLQCKVTLEYDRGVPENAIEQMQELFSREEVLVQKKSKNGIQEQNIIPMIKSFDLVSDNLNTLTINATVCCQNPSLNPMQLAAAVERYLPELKPDFCYCSRLEIYDGNLEVFR